MCDTCGCGDTKLVPVELQERLLVVMRTRVGGTRVVDLHPGETLPRTC